MWSSWRIAHSSSSGTDTETELVVQGNVCWLRTKVLNGDVDGTLLCAVDDVEMRALGGSSREIWPSSAQSMNIRAALMQAAEAHRPKVRVRPDPGNPSEAEQDEHNATDLLVRSWCEHRRQKDARLATQASQFRA